MEAIIINNLFFAWCYKFLASNIHLEVDIDSDAIVRSVWVTAANENIAVKMPKRRFIPKATPSGVDLLVIGEINFDYEIRDAGRKGLGLFAMRDNIRGETVIVERQATARDTHDSSMAYLIKKDLSASQEDAIERKSFQEATFLRSFPLTRSEG